MIERFGLWSQEYFEWESRDFRLKDWVASDASDQSNRMNDSKEILEWLAYNTMWSSDTWEKEEEDADR